MKKYAVLGMIVLFMFSMAITAQEQTTPPAQKGHRKEMRKGDQPMLTPEKRAEHLAVQVGLTEAEKVKVQALFEKQDANRKQHQAEVKKVREAQKAKFETERKAQDAELEKIIGKEKFQKHDSIRAIRHEKMIQRREKSSNDSTFVGKRGARKASRVN